jgi:hypothetical protein
VVDVGALEEMVAMDNVLRDHHPSDGREIKASGIKGIQDELRELQEPDTESAIDVSLSILAVLGEMEGRKNVKRSTAGKT